MFVSETIVAILKEFLLKHDSNIALYICDSSDGRQDLRKRKFDQWYYKDQGNTFTKMNEAMRVSQGNLYFITIIL